MMAGQSKEPDLSNILAHLRFITRRWGEVGEPCQIEIRTVGENVTPLHGRFAWDAEGLEMAAQFAFDMSNHPGRNAYAVINPVRPGGNAANDRDVICSFYNWADADSPDAVANLKEWVGPQWRGTTRTGTIPHNRVHVAWELAEPQRDMDAWTRVQMAIAARLASDRKVINPSRIMRLGGTRTWPGAEKRRRGYVEEVSRFYQHLDRPLVEFDALARSFGASAAPRSAPSGGGLWAEAVPAPMDREAAVRAALNGEEWHNHVIRVVASYVARGLSDDEIHALTDPLTLPGYTVEQTRREVQTAIAGARRKGFDARPEPLRIDHLFRSEKVTSPEHDANENNDLDGDKVTSLAPGEITPELLDAIAPRPWLYGRKFLRGFVSIVGSPGGVGKSTILTGMFLDMASGHNRLHDEPLKPLRVWYYNLEDPADEQLRKVAAYVRHHNVPREVLGNFRINSGRDRRLIVAEQDRFGNVIATPDAPALVEACKEHGVDVLCVDPVVRSHRLDENDNGHVDYIADLFSRVASEANIAVILVHHSRKGFVSGDADTFRGGSALISAARSAFTLAPMTADEAGEMGVPPDWRSRYVRMDNAKANLAPRALVAEWFYLDSHSLDNGAGEYPLGDSVGVATAWTPPTSTDGLTDKIINEILAAIERGQIAEDGFRSLYSARAQDKDRWVGDLITGVCARHGVDRTEAQNGQIIKEWLRSGLVEIGEFETRHRKPGKGLVRKGWVGGQDDAT